MFILPPGCIRFCKQTRDLKIYFRKPVIFRGLFVLPLKISGLPFFNHFLTKIISKKIKYIMNNIINKFSASGNNRIAIIAGIFLMVSSGLFSCKNAETSNQQASQPTHAMDSLKVVTDSLQSQYSASRVEIDELTSKTALLDSQIRLKDKEIAKWKGQARKLEKKNKSLAAQMKKDGKLISDLKDELNGKSKEYAEKLGTLQSDRDNLAAQRDELMAKYNKLKALGSVLHASNFRIEPLHEKRNGREKATKRAKKVDS
jgi:peptidoglycan hydrolase CwlO-like protein